MVVRNHDQDPDEIVWQALKIGYDNLAGELAGGMAAWAAAGAAGRRTAAARARPGRPGAVLDVRQASEYAAGHLPGAAHIELGALAGQRDLPHRARSW